MVLMMDYMVIFCHAFMITLPVLLIGGFNHLETYENQLEGLSHI